MDNNNKGLNRQFIMYTDVLPHVELKNELDDIKVKLDTLHGEIKWVIQAIQDVDKCLTNRINRVYAKLDLPYTSPRKYIW